MKTKIGMLKFKWYTPKEIEKMSVCEITVPKSLDVYGHSIKNGMYDLRMGPLSAKDKCEYCNLNFIKCIGHFGHISLPFPVLSPLMADLALKLLNSLCISCKKFKCTETDKIKYLEMIRNAKKIEDFVLTSSEDKEKEIPTRKKDNFIDHHLLQELFSRCNARRICQSCSFKNGSYKKISGTLQIMNTTTEEVITNSTIKIFMDELCDNESILINEMFNDSKSKEEEENSGTPLDMLFVEKLFVIPNHFRLPMHVNGETFEHTLNTILNSILKYSAEISKIVEEQEGRKDSNISALEGTMAELQNQVKIYFEGNIKQYNSAKGIKQILEKKEGLFRMNIMGKRVNYSARSVISPDPYISTDEIGIPLIFAKTLTYPEKVTSFNKQILANAVLNGPKVYPGANYITYKSGLINLSYIKPEKRDNFITVIKENKEPITVHRHAIDGDFFLVNRQPTLHLVSLMGHKARILQNEKTLRMHYVNCKPYNADFDGDEMNIHFPQDDISKSEISTLANVRNNFLVPSTDAPIRGLTQDHIVAATIISMKSSIFTSNEYYKILVDSIGSIVGFGNIKIIKPAIILPDKRKFYTGKQIVTGILVNLSVNLTATIKGKFAIGEGCSLFVNSYYCYGLLDKNTLGTSKGSIPHLAGLSYGLSICDTILTAFGRMVNSFLLFKGFSIRYDDLLASKQGNTLRKAIFNNTPYDEITSVSSKTAMILKSKKDSTLMFKEQLMNNNFYITVQSGAKGSLVNFSQISISLGQQEIEGKKVPVTSNGKTLPMYGQGEHLTNPAASGFIYERFLTGINPGTMYFHCMAGREGLVDTAVKTANSGYLQRTLIKHLEGVYVAYDSTVRNFDSKIIQFSGGSSSDRQCYGKNVGILAAQSIGEPSTQMTLNTFHLAGVAGKNVTLGIPRLREILMFASKEIGTPQIVISSTAESVILNEGDFTVKDRLSGVFTKKYLFEFIENLRVENTLFVNAEKESVSRIIKIIFKVSKNNKKIERKIKKSFIRLLNKQLQKHFGNTEDFGFIKEEIGNISHGRNRDLSKESSVDETEETTMESDDRVSDLDEETAASSSESDTGTSLSGQHPFEMGGDSEESSEEDKERDIKVEGDLYSIQMTVAPEMTFYVSPAIEKVLKKIVISEVVGFDRDVVDDEGNLILSGNNFYSFYSKLVNLKIPEIVFYSCCSTNDIYAAFKYFGVEAGRAVIVNEIFNVFDVYGISIKSRHLELVADFMTKDGIFASFHRKSFNYESILQMFSFESCYSIIKKVGMFNMSDNMKSPSASITVGNYLEAGTGYPEILFDLNKL